MKTPKNTTVLSKKTPHEAVFLKGFETQGMPRSGNA
jgi:hypothetical protein